jgi:hypothetical protein
MFVGTGGRASMPDEPLPRCPTTRQNEGRWLAGDQIKALLLRLRGGDD